jgi:hypothetical protein
MVRLTVLLLPLLLTWPLGWATMEGYLNFGGGEKDIILAVPWIIWSIIFAIAGGVYWKRGRPLGSATARSAAVAALITVVLVMGLAFGLEALN